MGVSKAVHTGIALAIASGIMITVLGLLFGPSVLKLTNTPEAVFDDAKLYTLVYFAGGIALVVYNVGSGIMRALGDSKRPMIYLMICCVVNIVLDCLFIFVFHTGVEGAAVATVAAQMISVLVCCQKLHQNMKLHLIRDDFMKDHAISLSLLSNGVPAALMNSVTAVGCMVVQGYVNAMGAAFTSAYSACTKYLNLIMLPSLTAGFSLSAFVSQNKGAGNVQRIREGVRVGVWIAFVSWIVIGSLMLLIPEQLASVILNERETISLAAGFLRICSVSLLLLNLLFIFRSTVQGMGHPLIPMCSGIAEMALRMSVIIFMMKSVGFVATAYAESIAWIGALGLNVVAYIVFIRQAEDQSATTTSFTE